MAKPLVGVFTIKAHKAKELESVQLIGKQDPYVVLDGPHNQKYKSKWHEDGGRSPTWEQVFQVYFSESGEAKDRAVHLSVWDKNLVSDTVIGQVTYHAGDLLGFSGKGPQWHGITTPKAGKYAGSLWLDITFQPGLGIHVLEGKNLTIVQSVGKQDPYVVLHLGDQKVRTKECSDGGANPKWTNELHYFANNPNVDPEEEKQNSFHFDVIDANVLVDKAIGTATVPFSVLAKAQGQGPKEYPIFRGRDKEHAGVLIISTEHYKVPTS